VNVILIFCVVMWHAAMADAISDKPIFKVETDVQIASTDGKVVREEEAFQQINDYSN
jgi:uncharacterized protein involved in exopolysaccharide biosynthesis